MLTAWVICVYDLVSHAKNYPLILTILLIDMHTTCYEKQPLIETSLPENGKSTVSTYSFTVNDLWNSLHGIHLVKK